MTERSVLRALTIALILAGCGRLDGGPTDPNTMPAEPLAAPPAQMEGRAPAVPAAPAAAPVEQSPRTPVETGIYVRFQPDDLTLAPAVPAPVESEPTPRQRRYLQAWRAQEASWAPLSPQEREMRRDALKRQILGE
jgi:hypothetical protein